MVITARQAETAAVARTIDATTEQCWAILQALPEKEAKKVLAALRQRVTPPKTAEQIGMPEAPVGIVADANLDAGATPEQMGMEPTPVIEPAAQTDQAAQ